MIDRAKSTIAGLLLGWVASIVSVLLGYLL